MEVVATAVVAVPEVVAAVIDQVGLGWRGELAASIFSHLEQIDILEVIADEYFHASRSHVQALRDLAENIPLTLHGVGMGLATTLPVESKRLSNMARLLERVPAHSWSEHLAFVRAGEIEIGHLAAPPRTPASVAGTIKNVLQAEQIVGSLPLLENIATLIAPPASTLDEAQWITHILQGSGAGMLLDLHNLYANALNFGTPPAKLLMAMPLHLVRSVHLSGGHWIDEPNGTGKRLLDDHVHDVPPEVFDLLSLLAQHAPQALTVIIERDGNYPAFSQLLAQIRQAREALAEGRKQANRILPKPALRYPTPETS